MPENIDGMRHEISTVGPLDVLYFRLFTLLFLAQAKEIIVPLACLIFKLYTLIHGWNKIMKNDISHYDSIRS